MQINTKLNNKLNEHVLKITKKNAALRKENLYVVHILNITAIKYGRQVVSWNLKQKRTIQSNKKKTTKENSQWTFYKSAPMQKKTRQWHTADVEKLPFLFFLWVCFFVVKDLFCSLGEFLHNFNISHQIVRS